MDEYAKNCIRWLLENDTKSLDEIVNNVRNSKVLTEGMNVEEVVQLITVVDDENEEDSAIKCPKCEKYAVSFREVQNRGADEGASVFYSCGNCLNSWKER